MTQLGVVLIGAGWISEQYARALRQVPNADLVGVASRSLASAERLASEFGVPRAVSFDALEQFWADPAVRIACVNSPNHLHAEHGRAALRAGKWVCVEKPLCLSLEEADSLVDAAREADGDLGYAENLCFAPLYRRAASLLEAGEIGEPRGARQVEEHAGPYSDWFWRREYAGGGALMDMGCHGLACLRDLFGGPEIASVRAELATLEHRARTTMEDSARVTLELSDGRRLISESSWVAPAAQSRLEVLGSEGRLELDLVQAAELRLYSADGACRQVLQSESADLGYVGELQHFVNCAAGIEELTCSASDGRAVLELLMAAYASAGRTGAPVALPYRGAIAERPVDLWRRPMD